MPPESPQKPRGRTGKAATAQPGGPVVYRAPALDKGLDILELLATQPQGLTRAQIVRDMARSPNEIYRMLERLVARQYVTRSASGDRYALSLKLFALAHAHPPLNRLVNQALPVMDDFARRAEQSCHLGVYDRGSALVVAQVSSPLGWSFSLQRGARADLLDTACGHLLLAYADADTRQRMLAEQLPLDGEVPVPGEGLAQLLDSIRQQGFVERDSAQSFGVVDISFPVLGPDNNALATLTCPYMRRIDRHAGSDLAAVRKFLGEASAALSFTHNQRLTVAKSPA